MLPLPAAATLVVPVDGISFTGRGLFRGYSISNNEDTDPTTVAFYDGSGTGGVPIGSVQVPKLSSASVFPGAGAIAFERGLYVDRGTEDAQVVVYFNAETRIMHALGLFAEDTTDLSELGIMQVLADLAR